MSKPRDLADLVSAGNIFADGNIDVSEIVGLGNTDSPTFADLTLTGNIDVSGESSFVEIKETVYTLGTSGTVAIDPANGSIQTSAISGTITFTDSLEAGQTIVLMITGGGSNTVNWPTTTWYTPLGNAAPTLTAADTLVFWKVSTTLYGAYVGSGV